MRDHKLQCLWNTKYLPWYEAVKQLRAAAAVNDKQYMFHQMVKDGFTVSHISKYTQLERATVKHHLDAYKGDNK